MAPTASGSAQGEVTVLYQEKATPLSRALVTGEDLWVTLSDLQAAGGWELKPEGVCRGESCVPLPDGGRARFVHEQGGESWFNLSEFARLVEQPFAHADALRAWYFGPLGWEWKDRLSSLAAPDFTLSDLEGRRYSLSQYRGKKVLLALWASW